MKHIIYFAMKVAAVIAALVTGIFVIVKTKAIRTKAVLTNKRGEGFVDTAVKILMAVVIGALVLAGLYLLFNSTILPTLTQRIQDMFNYKG
jgi:lipopolysaccharide export LptBFGC system permease protein LptF